MMMKIAVLFLCFFATNQACFAKFPVSILVVGDQNQILEPVSPDFIQQRSSNGKPRPKLVQDLKNMVITLENAGISVNLLVDSLLEPFYRDEARTRADFILSVDDLSTGEFDDPFLRKLADIVSQHYGSEKIILHNTDFKTVAKTLIDRLVDLFTSQDLYMNSIHKAKIQAKMQQGNDLIEYSTEQSPLLLEWNFFEEKLFDEHAYDALVKSGLYWRERNNIIEVSYDNSNHLNHLVLKFHGDMNFNNQQNLKMDVIYAMLKKQFDERITTEIGKPNQKSHIIDFNDEAKILIMKTIEDLFRSSLSEFSVRFVSKLPPFDTDVTDSANWELEEYLIDNEPSQKFYFERYNDAE